MKFHKVLIFEDGGHEGSMLWEVALTIDSSSSSAASVVDRPPRPLERSESGACVVVRLKREANQVIYHIWTISAIYLFIAPELCRNFQFSETKISKLKPVQMGNRTHLRKKAGSAEVSTPDFEISR